MKNSPAKIAPSALYKFQHEYSAFLKGAPDTQRPQGVPSRQSKVYEELLFNNLCSFVDKCFPVARAALPKHTWHQLCQAFFRDWPCSTPYFLQIPREFADFLASAKVPDALPEWLAELAHYEWIELYVDTHTGKVITAAETERAETGPLKTNPTLQILQYQWPVQKISATFKPAEKEPTHLLVFRNSAHNVEFMATNMITAALLEIIEQTPATLDVTIQTLSRLVNHIAPDQLKEFAEPIVKNLLAKQALTN